MAKNRARDARRVAKSIRTHEKTMQAYSNAVLGGRPGNLSSTIQHPNASGSAMVTSMESYPSSVLHMRSETVRSTSSPASKIDRQKKKGLLTQGEAHMEKFEAQMLSDLDKNKQKRSTPVKDAGPMPRVAYSQNNQSKMGPKEHHKNDRKG